MAMLKAASIYFAVVFGAGFILGTIRVLFVVPLTGVRIAELCESPLMLLASAVAARWMVHRFCRGFSRAALLGVGLIAVVCMLAAELLVGVGLRGLSPVQVVTARIAVSGSVYYVLLGLFALMPWYFGPAASADSG